MFIYTSGFSKKKDSNRHCVSWINSNLQMAAIYLVFLKNKNTYVKLRIKLFRHVQIKI